jgi:hypothetical protein
MILTWHKSEPFMRMEELQIPCWCKVRNELNGLRPKKGVQDVVWSMDKDGAKKYPVMPRTFPPGVWKITGCNDHSAVDEHGAPKEGYLYPVFISTNAYAMLDIWELDKNGFYLRNTGEKCRDYFYGLHFSNSDWTHGCIRIKNEDDIRWLWDSCLPGDQLIVTE